MTNRQWWRRQIDRYEPRAFAVDRSDRPASPTHNTVLFSAAHLSKTGRFYAFERFSDRDWFLEENPSATACGNPEIGS